MKDILKKAPLKLNYKYKKARKPKWNYIKYKDIN